MTYAVQCYRFVDFTEIEDMVSDSFFSFFIILASIGSKSS